MKYSIILPYHDRATQFEYACKQFSVLYGNRDDYEIIVVEDGKNNCHVRKHNELLTIIDSNKLPIKIVVGGSFYNPATHFNLGVKNSIGEYIILSNPECVHAVDILSILDKETSLSEKYIVCACAYVTKYWYDENGSFAFDIDKWYQHSIHDNRQLHFCSCISRDAYIKIGGFDEMYSYGVAYEDNDFLMSVKTNNIYIESRDDLVVCHLHHNTSYQANDELVNRNASIYRKKWNI